MSRKKLWTQRVQLPKLEAALVLPEQYLQGMKGGGREKGSDNYAQKQPKQGEPPRQTGERQAKASKGEGAQPEEH